MGEEESDLEKSAGEEEAGGEASRGEGAVPVEEDDAPPAKRQKRSLGATATNHVSNLHPFADPESLGLVNVPHCCGVQSRHA